MSNEEDQCFQCQELGHIAHHCQNVHCFECNEYDHIAADCPDRIPPSGMPACHKRQHSNPRYCARSTSRHCHQDRCRHQQVKITVRLLQISKSQLHNNLHAEVIPDHITDATTGALYYTFTPAFIVIAMTCHTRDHLHIEVYQLILDIATDPDHVHHINQVGTPHLNPHPVPAGQQQIPRIRNKGGVTIVDPQSDFYSSDDTSSDSEDDLN